MGYGKSNHVLQTQVASRISKYDIRTTHPGGVSKDQAMTDERPGVFMYLIDKEDDRSEGTLFIDLAIPHVVKQDI